MTAHDIRVWGKEQGYDIGNSGKIPEEVRQAYEAHETATAVANGAKSKDDWTDLETPPDLTRGDEPQKKPTPVARARKAVQTARQTPKRQREKKPRKPIAKFVGGFWSGLAKFVATINQPVGIVLEMQAPVAGKILDEPIKGTVLDAVLQPFVQTGDKLDAVFALVGPPVIVGAITARPDMAGPLIVPLRASLKSWLKIAGPELDKIQEEEEEFEEKYGDRIDKMIAAILAPMQIEYQIEEV